MTFLAQLQGQQLRARNTLVTNCPGPIPPAIILRRENEHENRQILTSSTQISRKLVKRLTEQLFQLYKMGE